MSAAYEFQISEIIINLSLHCLLIDFFFFMLYFVYQTRHAIFPKIEKVAGRLGLKIVDELQTYQ